MTPEMLIKNNMDSVPCPLGKPLYSDNSTCLIRTPVNANNRQLFLTQSTDSHRKTTQLMWTLHYQLCAVISLSFLKVKNLQLTALQCSQHYSSLVQTILVSNKLCRERFSISNVQMGNLWECPWNDGFLKVKDVQLWCLCSVLSV